MVGIDKINFYTPHTYIDLIELATHRGIEPEKFTVGIGQSKMAVPPVSQDTVSMGANAAFPILSSNDLEKIDLIVVGTESGIDESKSTASFIHELLGIQPFAKSIEIKQACYGATAGLMMAVDFVTLNPTKKALVIGSDISRYGLSSSGEVTQGAGAIAMLITNNPRILEIDTTSVSMTKNIFDFWRPNYSDTAIVDGKYSNDEYVAFFNILWKEFKNRANLTLDDFSAFCFHLPYTKMGRKALNTILDETSDSKREKLLAHYDYSTLYTRDVGNIYTGSLYLSLIALLDNQENKLQSKDKIGFFSYGSGAVAEIFSGTLVDGYEAYLNSTQHKDLLDSRIKLTIPEYEEMFSVRPPVVDGVHPIKRHTYDTGHFYLSSIDEHRRYYSI